MKANLKMSSTKSQKKKKKQTLLSLNNQTINAPNKERMLKAVCEKCQVTYKGRPIKITPDFSPEILGRCQTDPKRTQMPAQATIPSQTFNYHTWRNQSIP